MGMASQPSPSWRAYLVPSALLLVSILLIGWLDFRPTPSRPVLVIFSPMTSNTEAFVAAASAGGRILGLGGLANSVVAQSDEPAFFTRLHQAGAWFIVDAFGRAGCGSNFKNKE